MAISPLDGRYAGRLAPYEQVFSEEALFRYRVVVEIEWFRTLAALPGVTELPALDPDIELALKRWPADFGPADVARIREIEAVTNHDVKAVEYFLKERLVALGLPPAQVEFVHFACTSEDINNLAHALILRDGIQGVWRADLGGLVEEVASLARTHAATPMPAHTHGQPATPTTLGKELAVFVARWRRQLASVDAWRPLGKLNGATGTFGAHVVAYPEVDWRRVSRDFVAGLGLEPNPLTTQIEPHDTMGEAFHLVVRANTILLDFCRDVWEYVSRGYLRQRTVTGEVGSSTMPHKVNPIDFENAEGNAGVSNALLGHLAEKLPVSRMQRDLTDSTVIRNIGPAVAHSGVAVRSARRGLGRIEAAPEVMAAELDGEWEVLAEAIQTVMRRHGLPEPYERLKALTRGERLGAEEVHRFVRDLGLPADAEARLLALTPATYVGLAADLVEELDSAPGTGTEAAVPPGGSRRP